MKQLTAVLTSLAVVSCVSVPVEQKPRLLVTITASTHELKRSEFVELTLTAQNIGNTIVEIPMYVERSNGYTFSSDPGEWGLMSPDYEWAGGGWCSVGGFSRFSLKPGERHILQKTLNLSSTQFHFPAGLYFADAQFVDARLFRTIDIKVIPAVVILVED